MDTEELERRIAEHQEWLEYHLNNRDRARETGSSNSEERNLMEAAQHAAILTALKAMT